MRRWCLDHRDGSHREVRKLRLSIYFDFRARRQTLQSVYAFLLLSGCCAQLQGESISPEALEARGAVCEGTLNENDDAAPLTSAAINSTCPANGPANGVIPNGSECNFFVLTEKLCTYNSNGQFNGEKSNVIGACACTSFP